MAKPREGHVQKLKHLIRYLLGAPRMACCYYRQEVRDAHLRTFVDSDHAGDLITRRSTSGMVIMRGKHLLRHSSTLQGPIGMNSAESEYYALVHGSAYSLGIQSNHEDWGL